MITLAAVLEKQRLLPDEVLRGLIASAQQQQKGVGEIAAETGLLTYQEIARAISHETQLPLVILYGSTFDPIALSRIPEEYCRCYNMVPLGIHSGVQRLAMGDPFNEEARRIALKYFNDPTICVAPMDEIHWAITTWYSRLAPGMTDETDENGGVSVISEMLRDNEVLLDDLLSMMSENKASDLHLTVGSPPLMRVHGELTPMPFAVLKSETLQPLIYSILTDIQITRFERQRELDFSYTTPDNTRFRVNGHRQRGSVGAVFRMIPSETPTLEKLRMPPIVRELTLRPRGLVLVTGPTGSGKSTTLAAMIDEINRTMRTHIVTVEDPIEFLHNNKMSVITQREVGSDTEGFATALRHVLRQDPDVILIGEMRDLETIAAALTAAETGHLVFATLHTTSAAQSIDRIVDVFPAHQQDQVRTQLANVLEGILTQTLLRTIDGKGRVCAQEILIGTSAIHTLIRDNKVHQMPSIMQASGKYGMQTLDQCLRTLVLEKRVTIDEAIAKSSNPEDFKALLAMQ